MKDGHEGSCHCKNIQTVKESRPICMLCMKEKKGRRKETPSHTPPKQVYKERCERTDEWLPAKQICYIKVYERDVPRLKLYPPTLESSATSDVCTSILPQS